MMFNNIFFDGINAKLELFLIGAFIFAIYWFILRKYNALGLRLFVLCFLLFIGCCVWIYKDEIQLKQAIERSEEHTANVLGKSIVGKQDNQVRVSFTGKNGEMIVANTTTYISKQEWEGFEVGKPLSILYRPDTHETFVQQSLMRFKADKFMLYYFAGFWLVLGIVLLIWLRKHKVGVDEFGNEWVTKPDGSVILDERKSTFSQTAKKINILSKMAQSFGR